MFRKLALCCSAIALVSSALFIPGSGAAGTKVDASQYEVHCGTMNKGIIGFKPPLIGGGTLAEITKVSGILDGCVATHTFDAGAPDIQVINGTVKGLLTGNTNDCGGLLGPANTTGALVVKWKTVPALLNPVTTITIGNGNVNGNVQALLGNLYGKFSISGAAVTGSFLGTDNGASSASTSITVQDAVALGNACGSIAGLKQVNIGPSSIDLK